MQRYLRMICLVMIFLSGSLFAAGSQLVGIRVVKQAAQTQFVFSFSDPVHVRIFSLNNPNRLVLDFDATRLAVHLNTVDLPTNEVKTIRYGYPKPHTMRLVLELNSSSRYRFAQSNAGRLITLSIAGVNTKRVPPKSFAVQPVQVQPVVNVTEPDVDQTPPQSSEKQMQAISVARPNSSFTVVIDAGHGGKDPGAIGVHGTDEKDVVLAIAKKLADLINHQSNMHAVLTRDGDYFVELRDRLKLARKGKADIFISIHADSYFGKGASGASVYALSHHGATSVAAKWIAQRENHSELGGVDLGELKDQSYLLRSVLVDLAQTATITDSLRLGNSVLDSLDNMTALHYTRVEQAPFMVLKSPDIPSILVETGFITNTREEARLGSSGYQNKLAQALFDGIRAYRKKYMTG